MEAKKALKIVGIVGGSLIVLLIGGVLIIPKVLANKSTEKKADETDPTSQPVGGGSVQPPINPIGEKSDIQKFQDWMDIKHPNWLDNKTSLNKGTGYGNFGSQTNKAWASFAPEYQKVTVVVPPKKVVKVYAIAKYTPVYKAAGDILPVHVAGASEYLGDLTGAVKKDFSGNRFLELKVANGLRYAHYNSVKLTA